MCRQLLALTILLLPIGCVTSRTPTCGLGDVAAWSAPPLDRAVSVRDGRTGEVVSFDAFLDALADADVVFLGETHIDETTHRVELAVYEGLLERRRGDVVLAMEMFQRDVQQDLDAYLAGEIDETTFLSRARPWGQYRVAYRPLIERARACGRPVVASNFPRPLLRRVAMEGPEVLDTLEGDAKGHAPAELFPNSKAYWRRVDNAIRSHRAMMGGGGSDDQRLYSSQSLWDNAMGEACATALDVHPGALVLHVNGAFHSAYWDGTVHQFRLRKPDARVITASIRPVANPAVAELEGKPSFDYVVFAEARATDLFDGTRSVYANRELRYVLQVPEGASTEARVPLLIWLSDDGLTASDGLDLWKDRLGDTTAIAVLEAPYREVQEDLGAGGRWFWPDTFSSDVGLLLTAIERVWGYLLRNYPIDPTRVCLAGEGTGATVVAAVGLLTERMDLEAVALSPRRYAKIKDFPLPLPEFRGDDTPPDKSLRVIVGEDDDAWWTAELSEYAEIGLDSSKIAATGDPWEVDLEAENALRSALGVEPVFQPVEDRSHTAATAAPQAKSLRYRYILVDGDSPRARHWARLRALRSTAQDGVRVAVLETPPEEAGHGRIPTDILPETFAGADALPRCPGPFGGTTVVVVPDGADRLDAGPTLEAWLALEEDDPLAKRGRFHRLRIAVAEGERSLPDVLSKLHDAGRNNVLIVPATFCADAATMRTLKRSVRRFENQMTLQWLPGLGGRKVPISPVRPVSPALPISTGDHTNHELSVVLEPDGHRVAVQDKIELPPSLRNTRAEFTLSAALTIRSSDPPVTRLAAGEDEYETRYALEMVPADGVVHLSYDGVFDFGLSDRKEQYTRGFRETRGMVSAEGVYLDGDSEWVPRFDDRMIRFSVEVLAPDGWHVISQGDGTSRDEDGRARWDSGGPLEQVYLVGGPLTVERDTAGAVEVLVYLHKRDETLARKYLEAAASYIEMYRGLIGPYPYGKFALIENFWETGYGMPSFTLLGPKVIRFPFILHSSYPHEILHNWWGNSVFVDYETGNWCEGLTAYLADHLIKEQRGKGTEYRRNTLQKYRSYVKDGRDFPLSEFRSRHSAATEAVGYGKALMTFHMLRRHVGDDAFRAALAGIYRKHRGRRASFGDLRAVFESVTDEDLGPFFSQWIDRSGAPALALSDVSVREVPDGFEITGSLEQVQEDEPFVLEVPLLVRTRKGHETFVLETRGRSQPFGFHVSSRPVSLLADPMFDVFRRLDPRETPPSIGQIFGEPHILAVLPASSGDGAEINRYRELMESWRSDDHDVEFALDTKLASLPDDRAVWVLGRGNRFAGIVLGDRSSGSITEPGATIVLGGEQVQVDGHSIVAVCRHPQSIEKAIGFITLEPAAARPGLSRKLPHYGKYSYLAFEGEEPTNVLKGQLSPGNSPLVIDLREDRREPLEPITLEQPEPLAELPPVFSQRALLDHVAWLASDRRGGRGLGNAGLDETAKYIAERMAAAGLEPGGDDGSWFQRFTVPVGPGGGPVEAVNVIGVLPAARPEWSDQSVVLSAHYDHLGLGWPDVHAGDEGKIHPGADDNASGVAVLLELARNLAANPSRARKEAAFPSRNLLIIAFSAEETNRSGSRHYVEHPRFPLEAVRGVINLDTVGRLFDRELAIHGTGTADEWPHIFRGCGFVTGIKSRNVPGGAEGSDQESFTEKGIPAVQVFTGAHRDYHRPTDTLDKVDGAGLVKVATFVKEAVTYLLEREEPLTVRIEGVKTPVAAAPRGGRKVVFGTVPDFAFQGEGVRIDSLVPDSPAARGGLQPGDVLVQLDDQPIRDLRAFSQFLKTLEPGAEVQATVIRNGAKVSARVVVERR